MEYIEAAGKYFGGGSSGGHAQQSSSSESGMDWSNLANLAKKYMDADGSTDGELDADTFKQHLYGQSGQGGRPQGYNQDSYDRPQEGHGEYTRPHEGRYERPSEGQGGYGRPPQSGGYGGSYTQEGSHGRPQQGGEGYQGGYDRPHEGRYESHGSPERPQGGYGGSSQGSGYGRPQEGEYGRPQESYDRPQGYGRVNEGQYGRPQGDESYGGGYGRPSEYGSDRPPHKQQSEFSGSEYDRPQGYDRPQSHGGRPPSGYPSEGSGHAPKPSGGGHAPPADANPDIIHQLLGAYSSHTGGEKFTGGSGQYEILAQLASKLTGQKMPVPMLEKLIKWKLNGMV